MVKGTGTMVGGYTLAKAVFNDVPETIKKGGQCWRHYWHLLRGGCGEINNRLKRQEGEERAHQSHSTQNPTIL